MLLALYLAGALANAEPAVVSGVELKAAAPQGLSYEGQCGPHAIALSQGVTRAPALTVDRKPVALSAQAEAFLNMRGAAYRAYSRCNGESFGLVVHRVTWEAGKGEAYAVYGAQVGAGGAVTRERVEASSAEGFFYR
ncbi:hypothetical protein [Caulobacter endophyticus]|uniref:hypothetical protein n=1 Tax=Caulobacter endophyticus TaxID=2172652 RepID=UPI00240F2B1C|nr:hypothetical protein [Caulobacter endophyticus]MDG2530534.1 hypothetical protein [Caulobacter endophyticus]